MYFKHDILKNVKVKKNKKKQKIKQIYFINKKIHKLKR